MDVILIIEADDSVIDIKCSPWKQEEATLRIRRDFHRAIRKVGPVELTPKSAAGFLVYICTFQLFGVHSLPRKGHSVRHQLTF